MWKDFTPKRKKDKTNPVSPLLCKESESQSELETDRVGKHKCSLYLVSLFSLRLVTC